jgi:hypothetical protein
VGGPAALDERDRAALRRLVRLRRAGEVPAPMHVCGSWFAVRSADQAEVLGAFRLSDPEPVTMGLGAAAWNHGEHTGRGADPAAAHAGCARAYVTPVLDGGWTLVFGPWPGAPHRTRVPPPPAAVRGWCAGLSRRFGAAHWYGQGCGTPWTAWCLAERGRVLRHYDAAAPERTTGAAHPAESGAVLPHEELPPAGPPAFPPGAFEGIPARDAETFLSCLEEVLRALDDPVRLRAPPRPSRARRWTRRRWGRPPACGARPCWRSPRAAGGTGTRRARCPCEGRAGQRPVSGLLKQRLFADVRYRPNLASSGSSV